MAPRRHDSHRDKHAKPNSRRKLTFSLGDNIVRDDDVVTFDDLTEHYPLPEGFAYQADATGAPVIIRREDGARFHFTIEDGVLTFDESYTALDGRPGSRTHEVFKKRA